MYIAHCESVEIGKFLEPALRVSQRTNQRKGTRLMCMGGFSFTSYNILYKVRSHCMRGCFFLTTPPNSRQILKQVILEEFIVDLHYFKLSAYISYCYVHFTSVYPPDSRSCIRICNHIWHLFVECSLSDILFKCFGSVAPI
jgi:hypothetical protein